MIKCTCINDIGRPSKIPENKWPNKGQEYTITFVTTVLPQNELAFQLQEINLGQSCFPYEYFLANRFSISKSDMGKLMDLIAESKEIGITTRELLSQTEFHA